MQDLPVREPSAGSRQERPYFCAACGRIITSESRRVEREGAFGHTFANPAGIVFGIGCFALAPGCGLAGEHTREHTWFRGYGWCYALCAGCASHLGWHYQGGDRDAFFGLILDRLIGPG